MMKNPLHPLSFYATAGIWNSDDYIQTRSRFTPIDLEVKLIRYYYGHPCQPNIICRTSCNERHGFAMGYA